MRSMLVGAPLMVAQKGAQTLRKKLMEGDSQSAELANGYPNNACSSSETAPVSSPSDFVELVQQRKRRICHGESSPAF